MVESILHKQLKQAVRDQLSEGCQCQFESVVGFGGEDSLRVDVRYTRNARFYLVECETKPVLDRLREKGRRRNKNRYRTNYVLVVPTSEYHHDWIDLRGFFDLVYCFDVEKDMFTAKRDLRTLGFLQDLLLDIVMPVVRSREFMNTRRWVRRNKNLRINCLNCLMGKRRPLCWTLKSCFFYHVLWGTLKWN